MPSVNYCAILLLLVGAIALGHASNGDRTQFFHNCRQNCERQNCSADGLEIQEQAVNFYKQSIFDQIFQWSCADECQYGCMWRTVAAFAERGWSIPQFYGKWPFLRMLGMQEPASVIFSILNFIMHLRMLSKFRREVRPDSPCYMLAHIFGVTCLNGWIWSSIFHTRDFPLTELLDYAFAYSIVLCTFYCMLMRMLHRYSLFLRGVITLAIVSYYINYFAYLSVGKFNYSFNMKVNIATGVLRCGLVHLVSSSAHSAALLPEDSSLLRAICSGHEPRAVGLSAHRLDSRCPCAVAFCNSPSGFALLRFHD